MKNHFITSLPKRRDGQLESFGVNPPVVSDTVASKDHSFLSIVHVTRVSRGDLYSFLLSQLNGVINMEKLGKCLNNIIFVQTFLLLPKKVTNEN